MYGAPRAPARLRGSGLFDLLNGLSAQQLINVLSDDVAQFGGTESFGIAQQLVQPILQRKLVLEQLEAQKLVAQAAEDLQRASVELSRQSIILQVATAAIAVLALAVAVLGIK